MHNFLWSTVEHNLDDHTAANIGKFYLAHDAPYCLIVTDNTNTMLAAFRYIPKDDEICCIAHISSLIACGPDCIRTWVLLQKEYQKS